MKKIMVLFILSIFAISEQSSADIGEVTRSHKSLAGVKDLRVEGEAALFSCIVAAAQSNHVGIGHVIDFKTPQQTKEVIIGDLKFKITLVSWSGNIFQDVQPMIKVISNVAEFEASVVFKEAGTRHIFENTFYSSMFFNIKGVKENNYSISCGS